MKKISYVCDICGSSFPEKVLGDAELRSSYDGVAGSGDYVRWFEHMCRPCIDGLIAVVDAYAKGRQ